MDIKEIAEKLGAKKYGKNYRAHCPAHDDKSPSLWFSVDKGKIYFECKAGCSYIEIREALNITGKIKFTESEERDPIAEAIRREKIHRLWDRSTPVDLEVPTPAALYLSKVRGVLKPGELVPAVIREVKAIGYFNHDLTHVGDYPAMITRIDDTTGSIATLHRTYLDESGNKAPVEKTKKLMMSPYGGCTDGGAIRLHAPVDGVLGIAEGIETALAARLLFGIPVWAAWSASGLGKFKPPDGLTQLVIFADNDQAGIKAANALNRRLSEERVELEVTIELPQKLGEDFADCVK